MERLPPSTGFARVTVDRATGTVLEDKVYEYPSISDVARDLVIISKCLRNRHTGSVGSIFRLRTCV